MTFEKQILCIGAGYVGGPTMAMIAFKCPQYKVTVVDINPERIAQWNSDELPIYEPGLDEIVKARRGVNLFFNTDVEKEIRECEIIFVSVNTPTKNFGAGAGMAADLQYWDKTARQIRECARSDKIIVEKSTLPVKTAQAMKRILTCEDNGIRFDVLSNPEFLAEGTAVRDLEDPDRVLIGSTQTPNGIKARDILVEVYANWVPRDRIITSNIWSSELSKLVANAFLAQRISSINSISALCEKADADIQEVADYWEGVVRINDYQKERFILKMMDALFNTLADKKICLLGFAFKADTGDTRESPAIFVANRLLEERARVVITDPKALENAMVDMEGVPGDISYEEDPYAACDGCSAIAVMTEWRVFAALDYERIYRSMAKPAFVFDGRNILDHQRLFEIGFNVFPIGKPGLTHF